MQFEIIEDCSPYYIRYKHTGSDEVIDMAKEQKLLFVDNMPVKNEFIHIRLPEQTGISILDKVYGSKKLNLITKRVSLFVTQPKYYYRPHKDGIAVRMGINYCVDISDNKCVTSWYNDETFANRQISNFPKSNLIPDGVAPVKNSREIADYNRELEKDITKPVKSMIAKQGEVVLFNTDIWHDVDNTTSSNERTMLTLRSALFERLNFNQARQLLFGY